MNISINKYVIWQQLCRPNVNTEISTAVLNVLVDKAVPLVCMYRTIISKTVLITQSTTVLTTEFVLIVCKGSPKINTSVIIVQTPKCDECSNSESCT